MILETEKRPIWCGARLSAGEVSMPCTHRDELSAELCRARRLAKLAGRVGT